MSLPRSEIQAAVQPRQLNTLNDGVTFELKAHVIFYTRPGCHLCDEARTAIDKADCAAEYTLEVVNIEGDTELQNLYGYDIPVVAINGVEVFKHRVSSTQFREAIAKARE